MSRNSTKNPFGLIGKRTFCFASLLYLLTSSGSTKAAVNLIGLDRNFQNRYKLDSLDFLDRSVLKKNKSEEVQLIATNKKSLEEVRVLISEVVFKGIEDHPDKKRLEIAAYDSMSIRPGSKVTRDEVQRDLDTIYATGWFAGVRIESIEGPSGVQLLVQLEPNPVFRKIDISPSTKKISEVKIDEIFSEDYDKILNLNILQSRIKELKEWYSSKGYSLARIIGPNSINAEGTVKLTLQEGIVDGLEIEFIDSEGNLEDETGIKIKGKTRDWVIEREISTKKGSIFNRLDLESDIKRLYATSLFNDVKVTLKPIPDKPGHVIITLGITEQRTGSLTGGLGYSGAQGVFGQIGLQESNLTGRSWSTNMNLTYGEYGGLLNLSLFDPWIKDDKYRTSFRTSLYLSREVPQEFRSNDGGSIRGVAENYKGINSAYSYDINSSHYLDLDNNNNLVKIGPFSSIEQAKISAPSFSWFDYKGDSIVLERTGGGFSFSRPLNGGNPLKKAPWSILLGANFQKVEPIDYAGDERPYGVASPDFVDEKVPENNVICVAYNCSTENTLVSFKGAATYNNLNDLRNPTAGDYLNFGSEQFVPVGENSPAFNRSRISYSYFFPVNWLKIHKDCKPKKGEKPKCNQALGFQVKAGTIVGELPPYEAYCLGGTSSVRGWSSCDLAVARSFAEATAEYRFPIWRLLSGSFFFDTGTDFGSQEDVPGKPGKLLKKPGSGSSLGSGVVINTPVGPIRLEAASQDFSGNWRYNIGIGWKF